MFCAAGGVVSCALAFGGIGEGGLDSGGGLGDGIFDAIFTSYLIDACKLLPHVDRMFVTSDSPLSGGAGHHG